MSELNNSPVDWAKAGEIIQKLRNDEGSCVGICCDNAESGPNSAITVIDEWTGWAERTFFGDSVVDALQKALEARP